ATFQHENDKVYNLTGLASLNWPDSGAHTVLTATSDCSVTTFAIARDSSTVFFLAEDAGLEKLYAVSAKGGDVRPVGALERGALTNVAAAGQSLVADWESAVNPAELVRIEASTGRSESLTSFNAARIAGIEWQPLRHFWTSSKSGKKIHSMMALPPDFDEHKRYPLLVLLHGGPANMWRDQFFTRWNYHLLATPGYVVLLTNYTGSTGFGEKFAQEIQLDPFRGPANEINEAADDAIRRFPFIDGTRQAAAGA